MFGIYTTNDITILLHIPPIWQRRSRQGIKKDTKHPLYTYTNKYKRYYEEMIIFPEILYCFGQKLYSFLLTNRAIWYIIYGHLWAMRYSV